MVPLPCESEDPLAQEMAKLIPLAAALEAKIAQQEQQWLLTEVEQPLAEVLASMELIGFSLDTEGLAAYGQELDTQLTARAEEIYELAGGQFNINSPMQLGNVLFEKLGLPHGKKTQRGYSTNADVLESLRDQAPHHRLHSGLPQAGKAQEHLCGRAHQGGGRGRTGTQHLQAD